MDHFLGLYPRLVWFAPLVLGRGDGVCVGVNRFVARGMCRCLLGDRFPAKGTLGR